LAPECDPTAHSLDEQIAFQKAQIQELNEMFPDAFYIWNDGLDPRVMSREDAQAFAASLGPELICSANWWDWGKKGTPFLDVAVKEKRQFEEPATFPAETCWTLEDGWFWQEDTTTASYQKIREIRDIVWSKNSNFLLNVGPDQAGRIPPDSLEVLARLGEK